VITDPVPRADARRRGYLRSDELRVLALPPTASLQPLARAIAAALANDERGTVQAACADFAAEVARVHDVQAPSVSVLGVRPHRTSGGRCVYEKFGDYDLTAAQIRIWMRTAQRHRVTTYGTLLSTLSHELCHHLDVVHLGFPATPHTRGFFERAALLYHSARGTPLRRLVWVPLADGRYHIDWSRTMGR
jgi:hypothetical protein